MPSSVGLEAMNSTKPELDWKIVTKGRRSRKSVARSFNGVAKVGNSTSPKSVGDFSGPDSDKIGEVAPGPTSRRSESVPIKKMRHIVHSPSPHRFNPSLCCQVSVSPQTCSSPFFEDPKQLLYSKGHSACQKLSKRKLHRIDETSIVGLGDGFHDCYPTKHEYDDAGDFSGIELLASAASMYFDDNSNKKDLIAQDSLMPKDSDPSASATLSKDCLKMNEQENSSSDMSHMTAHGCNTDCSPVLSNSTAASQALFVSSEDVTRPKVNRQHWDLNTSMDAWEEPHDESIDGNTTNDVIIEKNKFTTVSPDIVCSVRPSFEKHFGEPASNPYFNATKINASERNVTAVSNCDTQLDSYNQDTGLKMPNEDCSSNVRESGRTSGSDRTRDVTAHDMPTSEMPESPFHVQCKDNRDSRTNSELPGACIQDGQLELIADTGIQDDGNCLSGSTITDSRGHFGVAVLVGKHEDNSLAIGSTTNATEDSSKSFSDGAHCDDPTASVGKFGPLNSSVSQNNHSKMVDGNNLSGFHQEAYDSPYEDGELRGSFMYSWEDIEIENECVDYESDGRNGDISDPADYHVSYIAGGGLEGSLRACVNNEIADKGSYAGSSPTVEEQSMELLIDDNDSFMKRSQLTGRRDRFDVKLAQEDDYTPKMANGKLYSCMEGRSSIVATDQKDAFFIRQFRSRQFASYQRPEREISSPDKYLGRYRTAIHGEREGERDEVRQFTSWVPRRHFNNNNNTSSYLGSENRTHTRPRSKTGDHPADKTRGWDFYHDPRPTVNYSTRSPPVVTGDNYFAPNRRIPPAHGSGNYRGRGRYSQRGGIRRNFRDGWDLGPPLPDDDVGLPPVRQPRYAKRYDDDVGLTPVRQRRYVSKREQSFSPTVSCRNPHMDLLPTRRVSLSRSRTRSPRATFHSRKEQHQPRVWGNNGYYRSGSPDLRPKARIDRRMMMSPFPKPDYGDGAYMSPQRNSFGDNYIRRRRSPLRVLRRGGNQRYDGKRLVDESFKPAMCPRRFSFGGVGGVAQQAHHLDDGGSVRRHWHSRRVGDVEPREFNNNYNSNNTDTKEDDIPKNCERLSADRGSSFGNVVRL